MLHSIFQVSQLLVWFRVSTGNIQNQFIQKVRRRMNLFTRYLLVIVCSFCTVTAIQAQDTDSGAWYMYFGNNRIGNNLYWHNEIQYRNHNWGGDLEQLLLRTGLGMNLSENNNTL
ncbi:MAG: DUF2490 domain-containing protein, partial [Saprospiraceae bacterium]|nr:DUF2490 domain-containing protein [Saprospiraceae bacterium]